MNENTPARGSNGKFRSRKLDFSKPLRICKYNELGHEEIDELFAISRTVPSVATGVEKEEEKEHHLVEALAAHSHGKRVTIPIPEASTEMMIIHLYIVPISDRRNITSSVYQK